VKKKNLGLAPPLVGGCGVSTNKKKGVQPFPQAVAPVPGGKAKKINIPKQKKPNTKNNLGLVTLFQET